jgi:uncharacterized protein with von Willebrand factor type A (vWA) domain
VTGPETELRGLVSFAWFVRGAGIAASPARVLAMVHAVSELSPAGQADVYWAGRITLCAGPEDLARYDRAFAAWFGARPPSAPRAVLIRETVNVRPAAAGAAETWQAHDDRSSPASASDLDVLRNKDIALMDDAERAQLRVMLAMLALAPPRRLTRRRRAAASGRVDSRRTVRAMLRRGGELGRVHYHDAASRPRRIVLLLDVSGSMSAYSDALLRYAYACVRCRPRTEVFTLGTRLTRITRQLIAPGPDAAMAAVAGAIADWSGGTRLGDGVKDFLDGYGQRGLARGAVVAVASDGWESGDAALLGSQMRRLRRLAHRVVWVHPHRARPGFEPLTAGIAAALPSVDDFIAGHSLAALTELSRLLSDRGQVPAHPGFRA